MYIHLVADGSGGDVQDDMQNSAVRPRISQMLMASIPFELPDTHGNRKDIVIVRAHWRAICSV